MSRFNTQTIYSVSELGILRKGYWIYLLVANQIRKPDVEIYITKKTNTIKYLRQQTFTKENFVKRNLQKISEVGLSEIFGNALGREVIVDGFPESRLPQKKSI